MIFLPIEPGEPFQEFSTTIEGQTYGFAFQWNERRGIWSMSIFESNGAAIATGLSVVVGIYIGNTRPHPLFSSGVFVVRTAGKLVDPGFNELGVTAFVAFISMSELVAQLAAG